MALQLLVLVYILLQSSPVAESFPIVSTNRPRARDGGTERACRSTRRRMLSIPPEEGSASEDAKMENADSIRRRHILTSVASGSVAASCSLLAAPPARALFFDNPEDEPFSPAKRPTAYRVDSTIPPTLLAIPTVSAQSTVLQDLGRGLGTEKEAAVSDNVVTLNNMLNKAVFGTADAVSQLFSSTDSRSPASFVCLGVPAQPSSVDMDLGLSLIQSITQQAAKAKKKPALSVSVFPYSTQSVLNAYTKGGSTSATSLSELQTALENAGVSPTTFQLYQPILEYAAQMKLDLIAAAVEIEDRQSVLGGGLQNINTVAREKYVVDPEGFIAQVNDPRFKLYTDQSLLKDAPSLPDRVGNFFSDRILAHEAAATAVAQYAWTNSPNAVVMMLAPVADVRYLNGLNGRIPRIYQKLASSSSSSTDASANTNPVTVNDVTTVLLNPNAADTLSKTRRLRLEIGTGPETLPYQTKVADYLWFSSSPSVSLLPRLMDY